MAPAGPIIDAVSAELGISCADVLSGDRHAPLPMARKLIAWRMRASGYELLAIGRVLGRSEATVRYYLRNLERRRKSEWQTIALCSRVKLRLDNPRRF